MTVVIGTAGHIDHGKTTLLRALTGIDADRLPEEQRRGMTIDVGYAHLRLPDGEELDFVDVPGHDRLVGNMLVGAGEIDAALIVVAADEGPAAQTVEHLELLDALGIRHGIGVVTKIDLLDPDDPRRVLVPEELAALLSRTSLAGSPLLEVSATTRAGLMELVDALAGLRDRVAAGGAAHGPARLPVDRAFSARGRGVVVTGSLRGSLARGDEVRVLPGGRAARVREIQVHGHQVERAADGGRTACNLAGVELDDVPRGAVLAAGPGVVATDRLLVALRPPAHLAAAGGRRPALRDGAQVRLHIGTDQVEAVVRGPGRGRFGGLAPASASGPHPEEAPAVLRLARPVAVAIGDRFALRWPPPVGTAAGGRVLDVRPPAGASRRRVTPERLALVAAADRAEVAADLVELHGVMSAADAAALAAAPAARAARDRGTTGDWLLAPDVADGLAADAASAVEAYLVEHPLAAGLSVAILRAGLARSVRRRATVDRRGAAAIADEVVARLVRDGRLERDGDVVRPAGRAAGLPADVVAAMDRLEALLAVPAPPPIEEAAAAAGCPTEGIRALEAAGRIVRLGGDVAYARDTYAQLEALALEMADRGSLTPAAFRDATGTSRRYALALLEDLDRRAVLQRTPDGHVRGPRAPRAGDAAGSGDAAGAGATAGHSTGSRA
jgi:selenocysteine-specific elongation factor